MNVNFLVNGRCFKTLCKTVLNAECFTVLFSTEVHTITANISDKCYFTSIDHKNIDSLKTDFYFNRNFKNKKEFITKLEEVVTTFINTSITEKHFHGNIDKCISKILDEIKETKRETAKNEPKTGHTYEIRVFKDGTFSYSNNFSLEKFAKYAFAIMELESIDFPEQCFKVIELFKDGKLVKMSSIYCGKIVLVVKNG